MPPTRNVLLILCHGLRADAYGGAGVWPLMTPDLDALADHGLNLVAVSPSVADAPARASMFTGLHPRQHGLLDESLNLPPLTGWAAAFRDSDYHMAGVGLVGPIAAQLHESCRVADLSQINSADCQYTLWAAKRGLQNLVTQQRKARLRGGPLEMAEAGMEEPMTDVDGFIAQRATAMLETLPTDRPWLMTVAFSGPGNDLAAPVLYRDLIDAQKLTGNFVPVQLRDIDTYAELDYPRSMLQSLTAQRVAEIRQHYLARVSMLDHFVANLREAVDRYGHARHTWIVLSSDRGTLLGERGLVGHRSFLSGAVEVPLWVLPPKGIGDKDMEAQVEGVVSGVDLAATLCAIGGVDVPRGCAGQSVTAALAGEGVGRAACLSEYGNLLMLQTDRHKVIFKDEGGRPVPRVLFDMVDDPQEKRNLALSLEGDNILDVLRLHLAEALVPLRAVRDL